jgi:hypothetical protein
MVDYLLLLPRLWLDLQRPSVGWLDVPASNHCFLVFLQETDGRN